MTLRSSVPISEVILRIFKNFALHIRQAFMKPLQRFSHHMLKVRIILSYSSSSCMQYRICKIDSYACENIRSVKAGLGQRRKIAPDDAAPAPVASLVPCDLDGFGQGTTPGSTVGAKV